MIEHHPFSLEGEIALITGSATGLGYGVAKSFISAGAKVILVGRREQLLRQAATELGENAAWIAQDITDLDQAPKLIESAETKFNHPVSILVNNAGIHLKKTAVETSPDAFEAVLRTHVLAAHALTRAALPSMVDRRHGSILFTASMTSLIGIPLVVAYSAAKSAYLGMVRSLAAELGPSGVRVNAIAPGWIETPMLREALDNDPQRSQRILSRTPMGRFGRPEDNGWAAVYICSPAARIVTGVLLPVDG